jgi:hypothetical protein
MRILMSSTLQLDQFRPENVAEVLDHLFEAVRPVAGDMKESGFVEEPFFILPLDAKLASIHRPRPFANLFTTRG